jgi:hypothetical protein
LFFCVHTASVHICSCYIYTPVVIMLAIDFIYNIRVL